MEKCVRFTIAKKGTRVEAIGFAGEGCTAAVDSLLSKMQAVPVVEPEYTADYHKEPPVMETENPDGG